MLASLFLLGAPGVLLNLGMIIFCGIGLLLVLAVLIQKPQGGGLSAAFGASAGGAGQTAFGTKTGDVLTLITIGMFGVWLVLGMVLNRGYRPDEAGAAPAANTSAPATPPATNPATPASQPAPDAAKPDPAKPEAAKPEAPKTDAPSANVPATTPPAAAPSTPPPGSTSPGPANPPANPPAPAPKL